MQRIPAPPRANLAARAAELDFDFHTIDGEIYSDERAYSAFSLTEVERDLEAPTAELAAPCLDLIGKVVAGERALQQLNIPEHDWGLFAEC